MEAKNLCCPVFAAIFLISLAAGADASPGSITRNIYPAAVSPGDEVTVTLDVKVSAGERYYLIDETPPSELQIQDTGELIEDAQGHLKIVQLQNAADRSYTYRLKAPDAEGAFVFSGIYQIDGMDQPAEVAGASSLNVSSASSALPFAAIVSVVVIALVVILAAVLLRKPKNA
ncbi:MAG: hypothetical protein JXC85_04665 [Candidatus Aenigmarchaeota archaeon]|nr:hypothetical protein [Candidatus Aenigmarchaeota archaeon]